MDIKNPKGAAGKSLSEALIFASTSPQYDIRLSIDLSVQNVQTTSSEHGENTGRTCCLQKLFVILWVS